MVFAAVEAVYGSQVVFRYALFGEVSPLLIGRTPMPFSTANLWALNGIALFWLAWAVRRSQQVERRRRVKASERALQFGLAALSSVTAVLVALISVLRK